MWAPRNLTKLDSFLFFSDGELYAGVYVDFMGTDSAIFRTLGTKTAMRTDQYNSRWLNGNASFYFHAGFFSHVLIIAQYKQYWNHAIAYS